MQVYSFSEKGRRDENEDFVLSRNLSDLISVHLVADGMGGYEYGAIAAEKAATGTERYIREHLTSGSIPEVIIKEAVNQANSDIQKLRQEYHSQMGTTLAGILIVNLTAYCFWLGDSRIYHLRDNRILFQSKDHSYVNDLLDKHIKLSPYELMQYRHIVTKAVLGEPEVLNPEIHTIQNLKDEDVFIISSDGIHTVIEPDEMEQLLQNNDILSFLQQVKQTCEQEGRDNYSMIVIREIRTTTVA